MKTTELIIYILFTKYAPHYQSYIITHQLLITLNLRSPTGGLAYGIPRKPTYLFVLRGVANSFPFSKPCCTVTIGFFELCATDTRKLHVPSITSITTESRWPAMSSGLCAGLRRMSSIIYNIGARTLAVHKT